MLQNINVSIPRTVIGMGAVQNLGGIAKSFSAGKILVMTDPGIIKAGIIDQVKNSLEKAELNFEVFDRCKEEAPMQLLEEIAGKVRAEGVDLLIGVGGGSVMDSCKVVSVIALSGMGISAYCAKRAHDKIDGRILPKILVPTTAGTGAEWSLNVVVYNHEINKMYIVRAWENEPDRVIIDPGLTAGLPQRVTADTGLDALSHAIEAYCSANASLYSDMMASTAIRLVAENLRQAYAKGQRNMEARYNMSLAAALAMNAMVVSGGGLNHFISEAVAPKTHTSHGASLTSTLPAVIEYNLISNPGKFALLAELMGENIEGMSILEAAARAAEAVRSLIRDLDLPAKLSDIGIREGDIPELARTCYEATRNAIATSNPRDAGEKDIINILRRAL